MLKIKDRSVSRDTVGPVLASSGIKFFGVPFYKGTFSNKKEEYGNDQASCLITDDVTPVDAKSSYWIHRQKLKNVYSGADIPAPYKAANTVGSRVIITHSNILTVEDTEDATYRVDYPVSCRIYLDIPHSELIDNKILEQLVYDTVMALYKGRYDESTSKSVYEPNILEIATGSVKPKGI